jgi:hypothetical protein
MAPTSPKLLLIDPLTLLGKEFALLLPELGEIHDRVGFAHTRDSDEHQIAEVGGHPALVPPLERPDDLEDALVIVVTSDSDGDRLDHLEAYLEQHPSTPLVDMSRLERFCDITEPTAGTLEGVSSRERLRIAHPALVAVAAVTRPLRHLGAVTVSVAAVDPVSSLGRESVEKLARQAAHRLQGGDAEDRIQNEILAFNQVVLTADRLTEEAALLMPGLDAVASLTLSGCFHGHLAHVGIGFETEVDLTDILDAWSVSPELVVSDASVRLDQVTECDQVLLSPPQLSPGRQLLCVSAMVDGLRLGGARTAIEVLRQVL